MDDYFVSSVLVFMFCQLVAANIPAPVVAAALSVVSGVPSSRLVPIIPIPALPTPTVVTTDVIAPCPHSLNDASSIAEPACHVIAEPACHVIVATPAKKPLTNSFHEFKPLASPSIAPLSSDATEFKPSIVPVTSASIAPVIGSGPATSPAAVLTLRREAHVFVPKLSATEFVPVTAFFRLVCFMFLFLCYFWFVLCVSSASLHNLLVCILN